LGQSDNNTFRAIINPRAIPAILFLLRSAVACNDLVEKIITSPIESVSIVAVAGCAELVFLCISTLATSVADIEALELAGRCRYKRSVLPAAV
jgi:hypothetical protein